ncbi:MAG TPA: TonB-dependent receptor plug domain-containing protein, partial [Noviherbaspirillum sp.]|nr:TonB-dependent receptor plug domain-containing protein [Noviherbaspirillum sp.]
MLEPYRPRPAALFLCACLLACGSGRAAATRLVDLSLEQLSEIVVTSVSRRDERLSDAAASIYVIRGEDIRRSGAGSLPEALRLAPNLQVARVNASDYAISARGGNSTTANKLLVLIDGRTVYTPLFSGVFWDAQAVMLADIERIEVISGPGTTMWGANAVNGVINIITRNAADTVGTLAETRVGQRERGVAVRHGTALGEQAHLRIYGMSSQSDATRRADGSLGGDRASHAQAGWRADWQRSGDHLTLQGDVYRARTGRTPGGPELAGANLLGRLSRRLDGDQDLVLQAYLEHSEREVPRSFHQRLDAVDVEFQHALTPAPAHRLMWGAGLRHARDRVDSGPVIAFLPPSRTLNHAHVFVHDQWTLSDRVGLGAGLKLEKNPDTGIEVMPDLRLTWRIGEAGLAWGTLARAVRAPARLDRDLYVPAVGGART